MRSKGALTRRWWPVLAALWLGATGMAYGLSLTVENGEITAVAGLEIQGERYDVTFQDGPFNALYAAGLSGYARLAEEAGQALSAASESGAIHSDPNWAPGLGLRGCTSKQSCTILIPDNSAGTAPTAQTTYALEVIYSNDQFRVVTTQLWPFDASTDTKYMPDLMYAILTPAR